MKNGDNVSFGYLKKKRPLMRPDDGMIDDRPLDRKGYSVEIRATKITQTPPMLFCCAGINHSLLDRNPPLCNASCTASVNQAHQRNGCTGRNTSYTDHLHATPHSCNHIVMPSPSTDNTSLHITKHKQSHTHDTDAPVECRHDLGGDEVRNQRDESTNEVSNGESQSADPGLVTVWCGLTVVEGEQKLKQALMRSM